MPNLFQRVREKFANKQTTQENRATVSGSLWKKRIEAANDYFGKWEKRFKCKKLDEYYEGHQWDTNDQYEPYVINLVYSTMSVKMPGLLFQNPVFHLKPKPSKSDFNFQEAHQAAQLKEDTLNYFCSSDVIGIADEAHFCILDSFSYFGVMEIGYAADWIDNPNAGKPILESDYDQDCDPTDAAELFQPEKLPEKEYIYVRRIPAHRFRVGGNDHAKLERNNWVGYYEFIRVEDLIAAGVSADILGDPVGMHRSADFVSDSESNLNSKGDLVKVWKIWDLRSKEKILIKDGTGEILLKPTKFSRLPLKALKFSERRKGFLPIPPVFNWKAPQDEINEAHEMNRAHRRKARSLYQAMEGQVDPDEMDKMLTAPDMTIIKVKRENAILPIMNPTMDSSMGVALQLSKDDFMVVSGGSSEDVGSIDRQTATDATIKAQKAQIRETHNQEVVGKWLCEIGEEIILQVKEKFTLPFWIKANADKPENPDEIQEITETYKLISTEELGDEDCIVDISVESMSPVTNDNEKKKFLEVCTLLQQFPLLGTNPDLVYELCARCGYRNQKVIKQLVKIAQLGLIIQMGQMQNAAGQISGQGGGGMIPQQGSNMQAPQNMQQNAKSPQLEQIRNQLMSQTGLK